MGWIWLVLERVPDPDRAFAFALVLGGGNS